MAPPSIQARIKIDTADLKRQLESAGLGSMIGRGAASRGGADGGGAGLLGAVGFGRGARGLAMAGPIAAGVAGGLAAVGITKQVISTLVQASPRLQGSLMVLKKSFEFLLRPIAEVVDLFVRPFAIQMLRIAIPVYRLWRKFLDRFLKPAQEAAGKVGEVVAGLEPDVKGALGVLKDWWENVFSPFVLDSWTRLKDWWSETFTPFVSDSWTALKDFVGKIITGDFVGAWEVAKAWWGETFLPFVTDTWTQLKDWWSESFVPFVTKSWDSLKSFIGSLIPQSVKDGWTTLKEFIFNLIHNLREPWARLKDFVSTAVIEPLKKAWATTKDFIMTNFVQPVKSAIDSVLGGVRQVFDFIRNAVSNLLSFFGRVGRGGSRRRQHGGLIDRTGFFQLEAGEFVFRPGQVKGGKPEGMGNTINFSPNITVNATINSDVDINRLAEQLSDLQHEELRRRISFMNDVF